IIPFGAEIAISDWPNLRYLRYTGRFGINQNDMAALKLNAQKLGTQLQASRKGEKILCLGTGEFMYIPFYIASYMGAGVFVQSTTRSPVHPCSEPAYAIKQAIVFDDPFKPGIKNFVYNIPPDHYDQVYVFWERMVRPAQVQPLVTALSALGIANITFIAHLEGV
ncbi:TRSP domain-containing protein, partial [Peptococcaceae bacterium]|nr:TRSP domain-containing protein [Peptococcaceae bacterium]